MLIVRMIDFNEQLVRSDVIALIDMELGDVSVNPREDIDDLIRRDVRCVGQTNIEILSERRHSTDRDEPCRLLVGFGACAQAKGYKNGDRNEDNDSESDEWMSEESTHGSACRLRARR